MGCATVGPRPESPALTPPPAAATADPPADWSVVKALAWLIEVFEPAPNLLDGVVRWQLAARDRLHQLEVALLPGVSREGWIAPDLTVLTLEPVAHTESSGFGWRDDPIRHTRSFHSGTDFRGDPGTPVVAAGDGIVIFCGRRGGYGNVIDIDHGGGVTTRYAHLRRIETTKNATVAAGTKIGQVGSTGRTTGPHLHFEVRLDGAPVSPIAAMSIAALQRESPVMGRLAALSLAPELQSVQLSDIDPPRQRAVPTKQASRPERAGRVKRPAALW